MVFLTNKSFLHFSLLCSIPASIWKVNWVCRLFYATEGNKIDISLKLTHSMPELLKQNLIHIRKLTPIKIWVTVVSALFIFSFFSIKILPAVRQFAIFSLLCWGECNANEWKEQTAAWRMLEMMLSALTDLWKDFLDISTMKICTVCWFSSPIYSFFLSVISVLSIDLTSFFSCMLKTHTMVT